MYRDGKGSNEAVLYKGADSQGKYHIIKKKDGSKINIHCAHLQLLEQPDFSNIPKTPLDFKNKVGKSISTDEAQQLARPRSLSPLQQELMSWHHRLYHLLLIISSC